jgi:hypothetical protein
MYLGRTMPPHAEGRTELDDQLSKERTVSASQKLKEYRAKQELKWAKFCIERGKPVVPLYRPR